MFRLAHSSLAVLLCTLLTGSDAGRLDSSTATAAQPRTVQLQMRFSF